MSYTSYFPETDLSATGTGQDGLRISGSGRTGAAGGSGGVDKAVAGSAGEALWQVAAGMAGGAGMRVLHAGIEAGQCMLGNRAFMHWVGTLQSGRREAVAPLQLMGRKKKQQGHAVAGKAKDKGAEPEGEEKPEAGIPVPQPGAQAAALPVEKKKKKSRVQVALNTLRGEGVAAFGGYIEAEIGETELLRTLVERINRAEDLRGVRMEALGLVEGRLRVLDTGGDVPSFREGQALRKQGQGAGRREPERAVIAPVKSELSLREKILFGACVEGNIRTLKRYIGHEGVDVNVSDEQATLLGHAAHRGRADIVEVLLDQPKIDVNLAQKGGAPPLYYAATQGHVEVVKLLLGARGINVNLATSEGATPLFIAAQQGHEEVVKLLLAVPGIGIDIQKEDGAPALFMAAQLGFTGIVKQLVRAGADANLPLADGMTPLSNAAGSGNTEIVKILLQAPGIRVNQATNMGLVPLSIAAQSGHKEIVRLLLRKRADPNIEIQGGLTPLHLASMCGNTAIVEMLLHAGADAAAEMNISEGLQLDPYRIAELAGFEEVKSVLAAHRRRREAAPPRLEQLSITEEQDAAGQPTARLSPVPPTPSPPGGEASGMEPPTHLARAKDAMREEVRSRLQAGSFNSREGFLLLQEVHAAVSLDALCAQYDRLAQVERQKQREEAAAPEYSLGAKTGLDADAVEGEIKRHLDPEYHWFVKQAVNDMEFGRGRPVAGYPRLWHASGGVAGVGSCAVFYYLEGSGEKIRVAGIGRYEGSGSYRLDYAAAELGEVGRILRIA